jgi:alpha-ribazole phosphatase
MTLRLHLVRHTPPLIAAGICYGQSDVGVNLSDCAQLVARIHASFPQLPPVYSSPLQRCAIPAQMLTPHAILEARLMELNFGRWEMQRWQDQIPRHEVNAWAADMSGYMPGGAENSMQLVARVRSFLCMLEQQQTTEAMLICHAGVIKVISCFNPRMSDSEIAVQLAACPSVGYGTVTSLNLMM